MNEFLEQFLLETRELVEQAMRSLLVLERFPADRNALNDAFRAFHTMKGGAGIVEFSAMARAVHGAEDALSAIRSGEIEISRTLISDSLAVVDQVGRWLDDIDRTGELPNSPDAAADKVIARFRLEGAVPGSGPPRDPGSDGAPAIGETATEILNEQLRALDIGDAASRDGHIGSVSKVAANVFRHYGLMDKAEAIDRAAASAVASASVEPLTDAIRSALGEEVVPASPLFATDTGARILRVDASRIDALVNAVGELIVAKNAIGHIARMAEEQGETVAPLLRDSVAGLERITNTVQNAVLSLRVLPLRTVFQRFLRVTREMAVELDKPTTLVIEGGDTEADKAIVEMLFEPLLHVVRNAIDHGIETSQERVSIGKPVIATLTLRARRSGEHVVVEIQDDGRGIDIAKIRSVAVDRGITSAEAVSGLDNAGLMELIFSPGFSTARRVTGLSGRGVGMDAVRTAIERTGGRVEVESERGRGTSIRFVLPFSVMMTRVMTVEAGGQQFGIPLESVIETARIPRDRITKVGTAGAFVLRDQTIPLIDLADTLGRPRAEPRLHEALVVVVSYSDQIGAVEVDRLGDRLDIMLKPIEGLLSGTPTIAGTTLTGDGRVLLILDLLDVFG